MYKERTDVLRIGLVTSPSRLDVRYALCYGACSLIF